MGRLWSILKRYISMPSAPSLALLTIPLNFLPHFGHSYMPKMVMVILIFLSGNGAISSHVLYGSLTSVPHSGQTFCLALDMTVASFSLAFKGLNLLLAQDFSEGLLTFWTVEKPYFKLHPLTRLVRASSHGPLLLWSVHNGSTFWTFTHLFSSKRPR